jgi:hypothetical protein
MEKRRQNLSCEECRKSKKACDGHLVNSSLCAKDSNVLVSCSYCLRTKKRCSLNPRWAQVYQPGDRQENGLPHRKRQRFQENESPNLFFGTTMVSDLDSMAQFFQPPPSQSSDGLGWDVPFTTSPHDSIVPPSTGSTNLREASYGDQDLDQIQYSGLDCFMDPAMTDCSPISDLSQVFSMHRSSMSAPWEDRKRKQWRGSRDSGSLQEYPDISLSPFDADHAAMTKTNKTLISQSLLRIYHDVLENNLGCWLAEDTCPYKMQSRRHDDLVSIQDPGTAQNSRMEWGGVWSNRMYRRVKQLDLVAQSAKLISLTASENQAASKALDLVIIAFATQWRQGDRNTWEDETEDGMFGGEFERTFQQTIWEQAKKALQDVSDLECYRVVFAELIFGLILKPGPSHEFDGRATENRDRSVKSSILPRVMDIIVQSGPPVFMERAARKINALKFRYEAREAGFQETMRTFSNSTARDKKAPQQFSSENRQTVGLLYWLAVMFDTLSASMNKRPVVISDEECRHDAAQEEAGDHTQISILSRRWKLDLYAQDDPEKPLQLYWPCPYDAATRAISRSAAVKVLLFRHISYLQNALRKSEHGQVVEEIINTTISVYHYWGKTHGVFFRDLTSNYESIPPRIKSWFLCIAIPWHLGCLMLADLIDFVDDNGLGLGNAERVDTDMAMTMRRTSSTELADLAVATTPPPDMLKTQLPDFHFAVNESPLLTEPWTVLLIRAFTKAAIFHLAEAEDKLRKLGWSVLGQEREMLRMSIAHGESCVGALRFLGAKSGIAGAISKVLFQSLDLYKRQEDGFISSQGLVF